MATMPATRGPSTLTFDTNAKVKLAVVVAGIFALFWQLLDFIPSGGFGGLVHAWIYKSDWSHGPIIPLFSAYLVHLKWDEIRKQPITHTWVGFVLMLFGSATYVLAISQVITFGSAVPFSMMIVILGVAIALVGVSVMRIAWVPYLYLFFAIPLPQRIYFEITNPLRIMAAEIATTTLALVPNLRIERSGSVIDAYFDGQHHAIGVADACSGMRSTITLCALGVAIAFIYPRPWWQKLILVAACIPIATFCNVLRVLITCALYIFVDEKYATGNYHMALGLVMLLLAFGIFSGLGWLLSRLVVEVDEDDDDVDGADDRATDDRAPSGPGRSPAVSG